MYVLLNSPSPSALLKYYMDPLPNKKFLKKMLDIHWHWKYMSIKWAFLYMQIQYT